MQARDIDYRDQAVNLRGYLALDETATARRPGVLVFRGPGLAGHQLRQHPARVHQSGRRRLDHLRRALQRAGRPPVMDVDAKPVR
jgi:hypothetical protein